MNQNYSHPETTPVETLHRKNMGITLLHILCNKGLLDAVKNVLMLAPKTIMVRDRWGNTPLHYASWNGRLQLVKFLIEKGGDYKSKNLKGITPVHVAKHRKHAEVLKFFKEQPKAVKRHLIGIKRGPSNKRKARSDLIITRKSRKRRFNDGDGDDDGLGTKQPFVMNKALMKEESLPSTLQLGEYSDPRGPVTVASMLISTPGVVSLTDINALFKRSREVLEQLVSSHKILHVTTSQSVQKQPLVFGADWTYTLNGSVRTFPTSVMFLLELALVQTTSTPVIFSVMDDPLTGKTYISSGNACREGSTMAIHIDRMWNMRVLHHSCLSGGFSELQRVPMSGPVYQHSLDQGETWVNFSAKDSIFIELLASRSRWKGKVYIGGGDNNPRVSTVTTETRFSLDLDNGIARFYNHVKNVVKYAYIRRAGGGLVSAQHSFIWGLGKQLVEATGRRNIPRGVAGETGETKFSVIATEATSPL